MMNCHVNMLDTLSRKKLVISKVVQVHFVLGMLNRVSWKQKLICGAWLCLIYVTGQTIFKIGKGNHV